MQRDRRKMRKDRAKSLMALADGVASASDGQTTRWTSASEPASQRSQHCQHLQILRNSSSSPAPAGLHVPVHVDLHAAHQVLYPIRTTI